jgi:hypothetical protein
MNPEIVAAFPGDIAMVIGALAGFLLLGFVASRAAKLGASLLPKRERADG